MGGVLWVAGIVLAGSDGALFPWLNFFGLVLLAASSLLVTERP